MANRTLHSGSTDAFRYQAGPQLLAIGMWLRFLIVGALAFVGGIAQLVVGEATNLLATAFIVGGAALAAGGWWRTSLLFDAVEAKVRKPKEEPMEGKPAAPPGSMRIATVVR